MRVELHPTVPQESSASEAHMNVYAWSYATLWNTAVQAAAGRVPHESLASRPRVSPRRRQPSIAKACDADPRCDPSSALPSAGNLYP